jgi:hypothetical protein
MLLSTGPKAALFRSLFSHHMMLFDYLDAAYAINSSEVPRQARQAIRYSAKTSPGEASVARKVAEEMAPVCFTRRTLSIEG